MYFGSNLLCGMIAFKSWFTVNGRLANATGSVCARMPERKTIRTVPGRSSLVAERSIPSSETWSCVSAISKDFMSFGETQGIVPFQYSGFDFDDVPPPTIVPSASSDTHSHPDGSGHGPWTEGCLA